MEKYVIKPNLKFFAVYEVTGKQKEEITNETTNDDFGGSITIVQNIDGLTLTSKRDVSYKIDYNGKEIIINEKSEEVAQLQEGIKLAYVSGRGFILPEFKLCTVEEAVSDLKVLEEV